MSILKNATLDRIFAHLGDENELNKQASKEKPVDDFAAFVNKLANEESYDPQKQSTETNAPDFTSAPQDGSVANSASASHNRDTSTMDDKRYSDDSNLDHTVETHTNKEVMKHDLPKEGQFDEISKQAMQELQLPVHQIDAIAKIAQAVIDINVERNQTALKKQAAVDNVLQEQFNRGFQAAIQEGQRLGKLAQDGMAPEAAPAPAPAQQGGGELDAMADQISQMIAAYAEQANSEQEQQLMANVLGILESQSAAEQQQMVPQQAAPQMAAPQMAAPGPEAAPPQGGMEVQASFKGLKPHQQFFLTKMAEEMDMDPSFGKHIEKTSAHWVVSEYNKAKKNK